MSKLNLVYLNTMSYFQARIIPVIILLVVGLYIYGEYLSLEKKEAYKAVIADCNSECLPNAGQVLGKINKETCWCFENESTLIKKQ